MTGYNKTLLSVAGLAGLATGVFVLTTLPARDNSEARYHVQRLLDESAATDDRFAIPTWQAPIWQGQLRVKTLRDTELIKGMEAMPSLGGEAITDTLGPTNAALQTRLEAAQAVRRRAQEERYYALRSHPPCDVAKDLYD
jgi:hypothetical protein